ncbi:uncharacterized protein [Littorina saxatilis]|uniref:uncharacterized protein n=1 Tax=Littorina saxatilis TaxID=31220 RepID=UPI0038B5B081
MGETYSVIDLTRVVETSMNKSTGEHYPEFFKELRDTGSSLRTDSSWKEYSRVLNAFRPILTPYEKAQLLLALDVFTRVCDAAGVTYFVFEASLMGVRRHHGMVPWDDDIDIVVNASQWRELHAVLSSVPGFELFAPSDVQWKFYLSASHAFPDKPFKFPYLDIFFFSEDEEFLWAITHGLKHDLVNPKTDIFPLLRRPFEGRLVQVPNNLHLLVEESHDVTECITGEYNHKTNERFKYLGKVSVLCSVLYNVYPFVERQRIGQERVQETLKIGEKVLHRMTFEERG